MQTQIKGDWNGSLNIQGTNFDVVFHFEETEGVYSGTFDSPAQGAMGVLLTEVSFESDTLKFAMTQAGFSYQGVLDTNTITGVFRQESMELPLVLKRFKATKPGDTTLVSSREELDALIALNKGNFPYTVADYFQRPKSSSFELSPNGKYLSYLEKDDQNKRHVFIKEVSTAR